MPPGCIPIEVFQAFSPGEKASERKQNKLVGITYTVWVWTWPRISQGEQNKARDKDTSLLLCTRPRYRAKVSYNIYNLERTIINKNVMENFYFY